MPVPQRPYDSDGLSVLVLRGRRDEEDVLLVLVDDGRKRMEDVLDDLYKLRRSIVDCRTIMCVGSAKGGREEGTCL